MEPERLIDANAIPYEEHYVPDLESGKQWEYKKELCVLKPVIDKMPTVDAVEGGYTAHEVAEILAELFGDSCACNFNGIDEWLPLKCELLDACPNTCGVACWEQYLKFRGRESKDNEV